MAIAVLDRLWHQTLGRPYRLAKTVDEGSGSPVVLLHGIGRTGSVWKHVITLLASGPYRAIAFDLLGFGASPKPGWLRYDVDDHAQAVIASIERLKLLEPVVLVGHSMGCLVATRVARLRPDLVRHLVVFEMPLFEGLPEKRRYRLRLELYNKMFESAKRYNPTADPKNARLADRLTWRIIGSEVSAETWQPFIRSLEHTVMKQTAADDIKQLTMPADVIYGTLDMFVIRGKPEQIFGSDSKTITAYNVRARHAISPKASRFIVARIAAAVVPEGSLGGG